MKFDFQELFPLIRYGTKDEFAGHCRFYFPDDPSECLDFVEKTIQMIEKENSFAWDACAVGGRVPSVECCKEYAKDNDVAYQVCIDRRNAMIKAATVHGMSTSTIVLVIILMVLMVWYGWFVYNYYF